MANLFIAKQFNANWKLQNIGRYLTFLLPNTGKKTKEMIWYES